MNSGMWCSTFSSGVISNWTNENRVPPCTINQAFQYFLDITTPPTPVLLQQFAALATNEKEKRKLEVLSKASSPIFAIASGADLYKTIEFLPHWRFAARFLARHKRDLRCTRVGCNQKYRLKDYLYTISISASKRPGHSLLLVILFVLIKICTFWVS